LKVWSICSPARIQVQNDVVVYPAYLRLCVTIQATMPTTVMISKVGTHIDEAGNCDDKQSRHSYSAVADGAFGRFTPTTPAISGAPFLYCTCGAGNGAIMPLRAGMQTDLEQETPCPRNSRVSSVFACCSFSPGC
jgi:hypothetical protein